MVRDPPWYLILHRHIRAIPHFATYRAIIVRYPIKQTRESFAILSLQVSRDMKSIAAGLRAKGPSRTKNTTAMQNIVNYYTVAFLLCPPILSTSDFQSEGGESFGETGGEFRGEVWKMIFKLLLLGKW